MRKKTTKFYFFKKKNSQIFFDLVFCLSKGFIKQKNKFIKIKKGIFNIRTKKQKIKSRLIIHYQNTLVQKFYFNQWQLLPKNLNTFFLTSKINNYTNKKLNLLLWFRFKNNYKFFFLKKIISYPNIGIVSSHYVHFFLRKNLTYQNRSKYASNVFNVLMFNKYIKFCQKFNMTKYTLKDYKIHWYSKTINNKNYNIDDEYNLIKSNWTESLNKVSHNRVNKVLKNSVYVDTVSYNIKNVQNVFLKLSDVNNYNNKDNYNLYLAQNFSTEDISILNANLNTKVHFYFNHYKSINYTLYNAFYKNF